MAAKPPKPPGNLLNCHNNKPTTEIPNNIQETQTTNENQLENSVAKNKNSRIATNALEGSANLDAGPRTTKTTCNCTNISIMHLFHEMKQEFPTIPDPIVAQCVNENCHQRENCMLILRKELALNPIPLQTYPAKVVHAQQQQQRYIQQQQQKPPTPLRPIRTAPSQPSNRTISAKRYPPNSDSVELAHKVNSNLSSNNSERFKDVQNSDNQSVNESFTKINNKNRDISKPVNISDMPSTTSTPLPAVNSASDTSIPTTAVTTAQRNCQSELINQFNNITNTSTTASPQQATRARPTTLDLYQQQQHLQRQQLKTQLQQHFQQRELPQHQQHQPQSQKITPLRRAPLPPIPPKPTQINTSVSIHQQTQLQPQSQSSNDSNLTSPISSSDDSELSVNVSLSSPTHQQANISNQQLKSPIRHRSVINVQPEPPYTRDFLVSPTSSNGSGSGSSQKSFTSVNLTLRQPNLSIPQSTIDISAGPGFSGGGGSGLTYSSTSYDARRGYQKNFHITVNDEGGVFSASRIRPRSCYYPGEHEQDGGPSGQSGVNPLRSVASEQSVLQQQYLVQQQRQPQQQFQLDQQLRRNLQPVSLHQQDIVASNNLQNAYMCLPKEADDFVEILQRQKTRRDKLATALRENKRKLGKVEEEINVLTEPADPGQSERLDNEIQRLRSSCETLLNEIENARRFGPNNQYNSNGANNNNNNVSSSRPQQSPQPFPRQRQRPPRPPPPLIARQLEFTQHPTNESPTITTTPISAVSNLQQQQQMSSPSSMNPAVSSIHGNQQYYQQYVPSTDEEDFSDSNTDCGDDDEEMEMWSCNMCTFRNHPQLNICECCDFVRILPGTIRIMPDDSSGSGSGGINPNLPSTAAAVNATASPSGTVLPANASASLENDANLTQQQLQQFALHT